MILLVHYTLMDQKQVADPKPEEKKPKRVFPEALKVLPITAFGYASRATKAASRAGTSF